MVICGHDVGRFKNHKYCQQHSDAAAGTYLVAGRVGVDNVVVDLSWTQSIDQVDYGQTGRDRGILEAGDCVCFTSFFQL